MVVEQAGDCPACCWWLVEFWVHWYFWHWFGAPRELVEVLIFHEADDFYDCGLCVVDVATAIAAGFFPYFFDLAFCDDSRACFYEAVCGAGGACIFCDDHDDAPFFLLVEWMAFQPFPGGTRASPCPGKLFVHGRK